VEKEESKIYNQDKFILIFFVKNQIQAFLLNYLSL